MGNFWSCLSDKSNQAIASAAEAPVLEPIPETAPSTINDLLDGKSNQAIASEAEDPVLKLIPDPDPAPSSINDLIDGGISFLGGTGDISGPNWFSMATTNFTAWLSQASGALAAIWGDDNEFLPEIDGVFLPDDVALPDGGRASDSKVRAFTFDQLKAATFNYRNDTMLGNGGFGNVYKGWLKEKVPSQDSRKWPIAVKRLHASSKQGHRQWQADVGFLARLSHPNIIKLVGYCREKEEYLIAYEFMQKGSLNYHLFGKDSKRLIPWEKRVKIATGMAHGLTYLHTLEKPIIFRDFKSSNVLLDESYTPKISDFGLAKWAPATGDSYITGQVVGTKGYAAPEYVRDGKLYIKSDVYSFGVVLVEMLTGLRVIDTSRPPQQQNLLNWIKPKLSERRQLKHIMDPRLEGKYPPRLASRMALVSALCLGDDPQFRPSMKEVSDKLERIAKSQETKKM
ncbi:hypothetical protein OIU76_027144 [Salix suchowensis]|nr:hypothetical protein OIU76_027144 [Salix suchowensis]